VKFFFRGNAVLDLYRAIRELQAERKRVIDLIRAMEEVGHVYAPAAGQATRSRRGRKSMGVAERQEVSERMRKYWARRRAQGNQSLAAAG